MAISWLTIFRRRTVIIARSTIIVLTAAIAKLASQTSPKRGPQRAVVETGRVCVAAGAELDLVDVLRFVEVLDFVELRLELTGLHLPYSG